ncbi:uncharacterized protein LTR77_005256 [Saxophila tyrrhenica]|uniref:Uncharacterized protein n=1 Tax=Saxophila tyrrhenica TaxID=1690608 RepID=A0AAV9PBW3_9PEZI|nr:hypothetical protein LTR77_005256 [Saxophila tyrrhenica]
MAQQDLENSITARTQPPPPTKAPTEPAGTQTQPEQASLQPIIPQLPYQPTEMQSETTRPRAPLGACLDQQLSRLNSGMCQLEGDYARAGKAFFALPTNTVEAIIYSWTHGTSDSLLAKAFYANGVDRPGVARFLSYLLDLRDEIGYELEAGDTKSADAKLEILDNEGERLASEVERVLAEIKDIYFRDHGVDRDLETNPVIRDLCDLQGTVFQHFERWLSCVPGHWSAIDSGALTIDQILYNAMNISDPVVSYEGDDQETLIPGTPLEESWRLPDDAGEAASDQTFPSDTARALARHERRSEDSVTLAGDWNPLVDAHGWEEGYFPFADAGDALENGIEVDQEPSFPFADAADRVHTEQEINDDIAAVAAGIEEDHRRDAHLYPWCECGCRD